MSAPQQESLDEWIGNTETVADQITPRMAAAYHATLDLPGTAPGMGEPVAAGFHWLLCPPIAPWRELGPDGHPARGGFLPPVPLPRRMWAGSTLNLARPLRVGDAVARMSTVRSLSTKQGRSGKLVFLGVEHAFTVNDDICVTEHQQVVYREPPPPAEAAPEPPREALPATPPLRSVTPDAPMLFRYSAVTFNGHRIHYDADYCRDVEGYPNCIIHGNLTGTTLMLAAESAAASRSRQLASFEFRARSPAFLGDSVSVYAEEAPDAISLRALKADGTLIMTAEATLTG